MSVVTTVTEGAGRGVLRGLERRERRKHIRYPGRGLYPFVLDIRGRWGREAHAFVQAMVGGLPKEKRADAIRHCRRAVAVAFQTGIANQIHAAGKAPDLAAPVSYINNSARNSLDTDEHVLSDVEFTTADEAAAELEAAAQRIAAQQRADANLQTPGDCPGHQAAAPCGTLAAAGG